MMKTMKGTYISLTGKPGCYLHCLEPSSWIDSPLSAADSEATKMPGSGAQDLTCRRPAKVNEGQPHPDEIVESALLAHVSPPDITYKHHLEVTI